MGLFHRFRRHSKPKPPPNDFDVPHDESGLEIIIQWLRNHGEVILDYSPKKELTVSQLSETEIALIAYTHIEQHLAPYQKGERILTLDFSGLQNIFHQNPSLTHLMINPESDRVLLKRTVFQLTRVVPQEQSGLLGLPDKSPTSLISTLKAYAEAHPTIHRITLGRLEQTKRTLYIVYVESPQRTQLVPDIAHAITQNCPDLAFPVEFTAHPFTQDPLYILYQRPSDR